MDYRLLGRSGLKISTITLGTMTIGGKSAFSEVGNVGLEEARRQIDLCIDAGVNPIDTADVYLSGACEEIVGEALAGSRKGGVLIATKVRFPMGKDPTTGVCRATISFGHARRSPPMGRAEATPEGTRQLAGWKEPPIRDEERLWRIVDTLVEIAEGRGVSAAQVALAWLIGRPGVTSVIIGGRTEAQLRDNLGAAGLTLAQDERARLAPSAHPLHPYWHQLWTASDRAGNADLSLLGPM